MMVGHTVNSAPKVHCFIDLRMKKIIHSCDVVWLGCECVKNTTDDDSLKMPPNDDDIDEDSDDDDKSIKTVHFAVTDLEGTPIERRVTCSQGHAAPPAPETPQAVREVARLAECNAGPVDSSDNDITVTETPDNPAGREDQASLLLDHLFDECLLFTQDTDDTDVEPPTFQEAWHHPDPEKQEKWHEVI